MFGKLSALAGLCLLTQALEVDAAPLGVGITGTCTFSCSSLGLADGGSIAGSILIDDAFFTPDGQSGNEALLSYFFQFGDYSFSSTDPPNPGFLVSWGSTPGSLFGLSISAFVSSDPAQPGPLLELGAYAYFIGNGFASNDGYSREIPGCCFEVSLGNMIAFDVDPVAPVPVPVPAALLIAGMAVLGVFGLRRRHPKRA